MLWNIFSSYSLNLQSPGFRLLLISIMPGSIRGEFTNGAEFKASASPNSPSGVSLEMDDGSYMAFVFNCDRADSTTAIFVCEGIGKALTVEEISNWEETRMPLLARFVKEVGHMQTEDLVSEDFGWENTESPIRFMMASHIDLSQVIMNHRQARS
jgi:hypothetical protein